MASRNADGRSLSTVAPSGDCPVSMEIPSTEKKLVVVKYDVSYRSEGDLPEDFPVGEDEEELEVIWERKSLLFEEATQASKVNTGGSLEVNEDGYESEAEPEIKSYIKDFCKRKKKGGQVNGEFIYYDESLCCVRNIHGSSISLTEYETINYKDFGRRKVMRPLMTPEEKAMLGVPPEFPSPDLLTSSPLPATTLSITRGRTDTSDLEKLFNQS